MNKVQMVKKCNVRNIKQTLIESKLQESCCDEHPKTTILTPTTVTDCDRVQRSVMCVVNNYAHESESHRESEFISTRHHLHEMLHTI